MCITGNQQHTMTPPTPTPAIRKRPVDAGGEIVVRKKKRPAHKAARGPVIDAVPLAMALPAAVRAAKGDQMTVPEEPPWIRKILFYRLGLRYDLPVVFVETKTVTRTDLDPHQNRFRLAALGVQLRFRPFLSYDEAVASSFIQPPPPPEGEQQLSPPPPPPPPAQAEEENGEEGKGKKKRGRMHGGMPVTVVHLQGGAKELLLTRWDSSGAAVVKGEGYMNFIVGKCGLREKDVVTVWAFKERGFGLFGATIPESPFYIVIAGGSGNCALAPPPPAPVAQDPAALIA
uniref:Uncharacterized protein n=1 Tax=Leersia perrieri TaxID=77586 RepID=A0A0D9X6C1_9ORYZ